MRSSASSSQVGPRSTPTPASPSSRTATTGVIKIRAGGSGQSSMVPATAATTTPTRAAAGNTTRVVLRPAAAAAATAATSGVVSSPVRSTNPSSNVTHRITLANKSTTPTTKTITTTTPTTPSTTSTTLTNIPTPTRSIPNNNTNTPSNSTPSTRSSVTASSSSTAAAATATTTPTPSSTVSKISSTYESRTSYDYPSDSSPSTTTTPSSQTPNGISLDLSTNPVPQLLALKNRSDRLRSACLNEDRLEVVNLLGQGTDPNQMDTYGNTALMLASSTGNVDIVEELLTHGSNVHLKDKYGQTALIFACSKGHYEVAKMLVERKAGVNVATMHGQTALMKVCYISHPHTGILSELLLTHHAKPDMMIPKDGTTAAHIAVENDHMDVLEILAKYGADMSKQRTTDSCDTLLHLAARKCSFTMIANLIALGSKIDVKNLKGETFLQVQPNMSSSTGKMMPLEEFQRKLMKAHDRGLMLREERRLEFEENRKIIEGLQKVKFKRMREEMIQQRLKEDGGDRRTLVEIEREVDDLLGIDHDEKLKDSRPSSPGLSYEELKERTYKPKIDPKSVFGDEETNYTTTTTTTTISDGRPTPTYISASAYPASYTDALNDIDTNNEY